MYFLHQFPGQLGKKSCDALGDLFDSHAFAIFKVPPKLFFLILGVVAGTSDVNLPKKAWLMMGKNYFAWGLPEIWRSLLELVLFPSFAKYENYSVFLSSPSFSFGEEDVHAPEQR